MVLLWLVVGIHNYRSNPFHMKVAHKLSLNLTNPKLRSCNLLDYTYLVECLGIEWFKLKKHRGKI